MLSIDEARSLARVKNKKDITQSIPLKRLEQAMADGWRLVNEGKSTARISREKSQLVFFIDRVWCLLYRMKFSSLSGEGGAKFRLDRRAVDAPESQIALLGIDSEIAIAAECISLESFSKVPNLQDRMEGIAAYRERLAKDVPQQWPAEYKRQIAILFFTRNVILTEEDRDFAKKVNIHLFDEQDLEYYEKLTAHVGPAAKYQFFSDILPGKVIPGLTITVPAVKTKMGGYNCYTFPISPEFLLKISYVSHRSKGKASDVNTYQRMIGKSRLKSIRDYISERGIFPTNIVVNLEKRCVSFQRTKQENSHEETDASGVAGWLTLRPAYKSAWIIDGQHRLFAYSGHPNARTGHLAVLAFEGISAATQARLFIDINAKQKSVKQSLLQELFAELHWDADVPSTRVQAIVSKAIQVMGSEKDSPLYGLIQTADAPKDSRRCISLASLFKAIDKAGFFIVKEAKGEILEAGPFWRDDNAETMRRCIVVIKKWLGTIKSGAEDWWQLGAADGGGLAMNDSITACINTLKSVLQHLDQTGKKCRVLSNADLASAVTPFAEALATYFGNLTPDERKRYRELRGVQGQTARTRRCQQVLREKFPSFNPPGLDEFLKGEKEQTNIRAKLIIDRLEVTLKHVVIDQLKREFSSDENSWWTDGVPKAVRLAVANRQENDDNRRGSKEAYFDLIDYRTIAHQCWPAFQALIGFGKKNESKDKQTKWLVEVNEWRNQVAHASSGVHLELEALAQLEQYEIQLKKNVRIEDVDDVNDIAEEEEVDA